MMKNLKKESVTRLFRTRGSEGKKIGGRREAEVEEEEKENRARGKGRKIREQGRKRRKCRKRGKGGRGGDRDGGGGWRAKGKWRNGKREGFEERRTRGDKRREEKAFTAWLCLIASHPCPNL
jgi:hypothetical protein